MIYTCKTCDGTGCLNAQESEGDYINFGPLETVVCMECLGTGDDIHKSECQCDDCQTSPVCEEKKAQGES